MNIPQLIFLILLDAHIYLQFWAIMDKTTVNTSWTYVLISLGNRSEIIGHLTFKETTKRFFKGDIPIYIPIINI